MVLQYRMVWTGARIGRGFTVFHIRPGVTLPSVSAQEFANRLRAAMANTGVTPLFPDDVTFTFEDEARELDTSTGQMLAVHSVTAPAQVAGTGTGSFASNAGAYTNLGTNAVVGGKRLKGRVFWVPLTSIAYTNTGSITAGAQTAFDGLVGSIRDIPGTYSLAVWSRTHGLLADVVAVNTSPRPATLRSRND